MANQLTSFKNQVDLLSNNSSSLLQAANNLKNRAANLRIKKLTVEPPRDAKAKGKLQSTSNSTGFEPAKKILPFAIISIILLLIFRTMKNA